MAKILVVDDEPDVLYFFRAVLEWEGHTVFEATDGLQALEVMRQNAPFELIIIDIVMPHMEGGELIKVIKQKQPEQKIIAISGDDRLSKDLCLKLATIHKVSATLMKPFDDAEFLAVLKKVLAHTDHQADASVQQQLPASEHQKKAGGASKDRPSMRVEPSRPKRPKSSIVSND